MPLCHNGGWLASPTGFSTEFAGSDQGGWNGQGLTYANPIHTVLDKLKIELAL